MAKNIIIIGMRGAGKTTTAGLLKQQLNMETFDIDREIETREQMSIKDLIENKGWDYFRAMETKILTELSQKTNLIVITGGGIILKEENVQLLKKLGKVFYLFATPETLYMRIGEDTARALVSGTSSMIKDLENLFNERRILYERAADFVLDTNLLSPQEVVEEIIDKIQADKKQPSRIDSNTKVYGIFGHPVIQTLSPIMHNLAFKMTGENAIYAAFDVEDIDKGIEAIRALHIHGVSITAPYKTNVVTHLDEKDELMAQIGACNVIINNNGKLKGYNTVGYGAFHALQESIGPEVQNKRIVILGAGAAARAIAFTLKQKNIQFVILNRTVEKAQALAAETGAIAGGSLTELSNYKDYDVILNATTVGADSSEISPSVIIDKELITPNHIVFDIVFKPKETPLIMAAKEKGAKVVYGYKMMLYQADEQFKLFTGKTFPLEEVEALLVKSLFG